MFLGFVNYLHVYNCVMLLAPIRKSCFGLRICPVEYQYVHFFSRKTIFTILEKKKKGLTFNVLEKLCSPIPSEASLTFFICFYFPTNPNELQSLSSLTPCIQYYILATILPLFFFFPLKSIKLFQTFFIATLLCCPANCRIISYIKFIFKFQYTYIISVIKYIHMYFLKSLKSFFLKLFIIILVFDVQIIA